MTGALRLANGRFARGFNCAQAIFSAFAGQFGVSSEFAMRLAAPFGGGIAREGEVCGALSGALMVLGLQYGKNRPEAKEEIYRIARDFMEQFRGQHGSIHCRELLGHDISTPEGLQAARDGNAFSTVCPLLIDETAKALARYLKDHPAS
jgi:C_GCAxxG_C_C family probable redox protein